MHSQRRGDLSVEDRVRKPIKGLRTKLRTFLRLQGLLGKFRTEVHRNGTLIVMGDVTGPRPTMFDGRAISYRAAR